MATIQILPPEIVNRIAAGEVIERPASVVKELVENSIDAGATEITVEIEEGGQRRIRVRDNGAGMPPDDLPLAFQSHATSKLALPERSDAWDLFAIGTLGFRGEALASIASIAEVEAVSRQPEAECGYRYRSSGGRAEGAGAHHSVNTRGEAAASPEPVAAPPGTSIEVRNLFFNTPARRKFLRSAATELSHVLEQVVRLSLGFPGIRFTLSDGGRQLLHCPATDSLRERLAAILGREKARQLLEVEAPEGPAGVEVRGFIGPPHLHRPDTRGQHFFVEGRWVRDRVLAHALQEAFRGFQIPGQRPLAYLYVNVPPGKVDVNVHPTKCEVRFLDSQAVHRASFAAVRHALEAERAVNSEESMPGASNRGASMLDRVQAAALDFFESGPPPPRHYPQSPSRSAPPDASRTAAGGNLPSEVPGAIPAGAAPVLQVLRTYLVQESAEGVVFTDQHALHEKILFERIVRQLTDGALPRQKLLVPEVVELPVELAPLLEQVAAQLAPLGFEVEAFGPREAAVHAIPAILDPEPAGPIVLEAARLLQEGGLGLEEAPRGDADNGGNGGSRGVRPLVGHTGVGPMGGQVRRLAQMLACRRAVKAGKALAQEEIQALLDAGGAAVDPRFCPHGRPTSVLIARSEIERRFQRR